MARRAKKPVKEIQKRYKGDTGDIEEIYAATVSPPYRPRVLSVYRSLPPGRGAGVRARRPPISDLLVSLHCSANGECLPPRAAGGVPRRQTGAAHRGLALLCQSAAQSASAHRRLQEATGARGQPLGVTEGISGATEADRNGLKGSRRGTTTNIQHRTSNIQWRPSAQSLDVGCSMLVVGCYPGSRR